MNARPDAEQRLLRMEAILTGLLRYGALVACGWLGCGMALTVFRDAFFSNAIPAALANGCLAIGIVLLIALPVLRVAIMMLVFAVQKDYCFAVISGVVLAIIALGFFLGTMSSFASGATVGVGRGSGDDCSSTSWVRISSGRG